jgi:hypothetical protein
MPIIKPKIRTSAFFISQFILKLMLNIMGNRTNANSYNFVLRYRKALIYLQMLPNIERQL